MRVLCQQFIDGVAIDPEWEIEPHEGLTPEALLRVKAESADAHGWDVEWLSETSFVARRVRWSPDALCERVFRLG